MVRKANTHKRRLQLFAHCREVRKMKEQGKRAESEKSEGNWGGLQGQGNYPAGIGKKRASHFQVVREREKQQTGRRGKGRSIEAGNTGP